MVFVWENLASFGIVWDVLHPSGLIWDHLEEPARRKHLWRGIWRDLERGSSLEGSGSSGRSRCLWETGRHHGILDGPGARAVGYRWDGDHGILEGLGLELSVIGGRRGREKRGDEEKEGKEEE